MTIQNIKISQLNDIGSNLSYTSTFPVDDLSANPITTKKGNLQIIGNYILSQAGGSNFVQAAQATLAQSVTNAAQPNITSVGTLTSLDVSGNLNISVDSLKISGGNNGYVLQTDGTGNLSWTRQTGNGSGGTPGGANTQIQYNNNGLFGGADGFTFNDVTGDIAIPSNISLGGGTIYGGTPTEVVTNAIITDIQKGNVANNYPAVITFDAAPFVYPIRGTAVIANVNTPTEVNGLWHFEAWFVNQIALFTDDTYSEYVYGSDWLAFSGQGDIDITINSPAADIKINSGGYETIFTNDGTVVLPTSSSTYNAALLSSPFDSNIDFYAGGNSRYTFSANGSINFPNQPTNQRTGSGEALMFTKSTTQKVIGTQPGNATNGVVERLVVAGGDGFDGGEGGDIYLWAGSSGANGGSGGDIKVDGGSGYNGSEGGTIKIRGGQSYDNGNGAGYGGFVEIYAGSGKYGAPVDIRAGQGDSQANSGNITLSTAYGGTWTFGADGNLTTPGNADFNGNVITLGPGASELAASLNNPTLVISDTGDAYIQAAINNVSDIGSADWAAYGHHGNSDGGWVDMGFASSFFNDPNYTITGPGDGYVITQAYPPGQAPAIGGGNLVLATGVEGTTKDIIFATGGFLVENEFARFEHSSNAFALTRANSILKFSANGLISNPANSSLDPQTPNVSTLVLTPDSRYYNQALVLDPTLPTHIHLRAPGGMGGIDDPLANIFLGGESSSFEVGAGTGTPPNVFIHSGGNTWTFSTDGNITLPGNTFAVNYANGSPVLPGNGAGAAGYPYHPPVSSQYTLDGTGTTYATMTDTSIGMSLELVAASGSNYDRAITATKSAPAGPYTFMARILPTATFDNSAGESIGGLCVKDSTGALINLYRYSDGNVYLQKWNNKGSFATSISTVAGPSYMTGEVWLAITLDGSGSMIVWFGNGLTWAQGPTILITTYLNSGPYEIGFHVASHNVAGQIAGMRIPYQDEIASLIPPQALRTSGSIQWTTAPINNTSPGTPGQSAYDTGGNLFVCVSTNTWAKFTGTISW